MFNSMDKKEFTNILRDWLKNFLERKVSSTHDILEIMVPESNLSKINSEQIKQISNYSSWEFKPDVLAILKDKSSGKLELVILNRSISALSLKEIGKINCYARLTGAYMALLASTNAVSNEVNILLLEDSIKNRVLGYEEDKQVIVFGWDEKNNRINTDSIIPFEQKDFLNS